MKTITVKNISKSFGKQIVFDGFNESFYSGQITAITGPSGSGKTTLLNMIALLVKPDAGIVEFDCNTIGEKEAQRFRSSRIGYVMQGFNLIDDMTVYQNIELPLKYNKNVKRRDRKQLIEAAAEKMDLLFAMNKYCRFLSGGEQQRTAIARGIVQQQDIILLDEPTGNLDKYNSEKVFSALKEIINDERIIIIVTHDKHLAQKCDREIIIDKYVI